jgi:hypothetical protein
MVWTRVAVASISARRKTLPTIGGEGGPDDREENILIIRALGAGWRFGVRV